MRAAAWRCWLAVFALGTLPVRAEDVQVVSPRPDSVSVTIYRDLFALVTETRTVDLPAGPVTLVFDGVVETLIPQSAVVADTGRTATESNHDFDRITPARILEESIGRKVMLTRTSPATGKVRQEEATLISASRDGVVFRTAAGAEALHCSGLPEQLTFEEVPGDLRAKSTLSIRLAAGAAGRRQVRVSYLALGFGWNADYVARLDAGAQTMDLRGWLTIENLTAADFRDAQVQVVAGRLNLLDKEEGGTSMLGDTGEYATDDSLDDSRYEALLNLRESPEDLEEDLPHPVEFFRGCYPLATTGNPQVRGLRQSLERAMDISRMSEWEELDEIVVTGLRGSMSMREPFADYQMYRLPEATNLGARQTKQVAFLYAPEVKVERFYALRIASEELNEVVDPYDEENFMPIDVRIGWQNRKADGLGEPLPGGIVRFFERGAEGDTFIGENRIKNSPVNTPMEVRIGKSLGLGVDIQGDPDELQANLLSLFTRRAYLPLRLRVMNDKARAVTVEIRQGPMDQFEDLRVVGASLAPKRKAGDYLWRFEVPAGGEQTLTYRVGGRVPDER
ncbi:MAG TPA: hypothetical protein VF033_09105 [Steroidobacteraceae bacterium]